MNVIPINPQSLVYHLFTGEFAPRGEKYINTRELSRLEKYTNLRELAIRIEKYTRNLSYDALFVALFLWQDHIYIAGISEYSREHAKDVACIQAIHHILPLVETSPAFNDNNYFTLCIAA